MSDDGICRDADAFHDGELAPERRRRFESHLGDCSSCAGALAWRRDLATRITGAPPPGPPPGPPAEVLARLHERISRLQTETADPRILRFAGALSAAAAAVLLACCYWIWQGPDTSRTPGSLELALQRTARDLLEEPEAADVEGPVPQEDLAMLIVNGLSADGGRHGGD